MNALLHPLIVGLFMECPDPAIRRMPVDRQERWLDTAAEILKLLYGNEALYDPEVAIASRGEFG